MENKKKEKIFLPDFLIIPYPLLEDKEITLIDERLYGIIYWFKKLKNEKCTAGNTILAKLCKTTPQTINNSLLKMENKEYIKRIFKDKSKRHRTEIIPLIVFAKIKLSTDTFTDVSNNQIHSQMYPDTPTDVSKSFPDTLTDEQNKNSINKNINNIIAAEAAKEDFSLKGLNNELAENKQLTTKERKNATADLIEKFKKQVDLDYNFTPEIDGTDYKRVYELLSRYARDDLDSIMDFYFDSEIYENKKFAKRPRVAFSADIINKWKQN